MSVAKMCNQFFAGHEKSQTYLKKVIINELFEFFYFFELFEFFTFFINIKKIPRDMLSRKNYFPKDCTDFTEIWTPWKSNLA